MDTQYLTPEELSARYRGEITTRTLANWRSRGEGPRFRKIGGKVLYTLADVLEWETSRARQSSSRLAKAAVSMVGLCRPMVGWAFSTVWGSGVIVT
jgi:hypothetical protein